MRNIRLLKYLFPLGLIFLPSFGFAAYNNITYPASVTVSLTGLNTTVTINAGANINNLAVGTSSIAVILERDGNGVSNITLTPASGYILKSSGGSSDSSGCGSPSLLLAGPGSVTTITDTITVQSCTSGNSGGGGSSSSTSTATSTPTTTTTPPPSGGGGGGAATPPSPAPTVSVGPVTIPSLSSNPSTNELATVITAVTKQIAYIQANLKAPNILAVLQDTIAKLAQVQNALSASPVPSGLKPFKNPISLGSKGDDVTALQNFLKSQGPDVYPEGTVSGYFGKVTEKALGRFQLKYGLVKSTKDVGYGYLGPKTRVKINSLLGL